MSVDSFNRFNTEFLPQHQEVARELAELAEDPNELVRAAVASGRAHGFDFTEDEMRQALAAQRPPSNDELSDADLAGVTGGAGLKTAGKAKMGIIIGDKSALGGYGGAEKGIIIIEN